MAPEPRDEGFVFATTGAGYTAMARSAVRSLRAAMPHAQVDLFTDQALEDDAFDKIHALEHSWFRPKMESLRRSRFARTVFLDADVIVRHDLSDLFRVLERFDATGVQMIRTNQGLGVYDPATEAPPCFPQINSGVFGIQRNAVTQHLLEAWEHTVRDTGAKFDQPSLRNLLWQGEVRLHVLPSQYNMMSHRLIRHWDSAMPAPRVIHLGELAPPYKGDPTRPYDLTRLIGRPLMRHLERLDRADVSLGGDPEYAVDALSGRDRGRRRRRLAKRLHDLQDKARQRLGRVR